MGKGKTHSKVRFDGVDVAAMVSHVQRTLLGRRVINIYDGYSEGADGYLFKFDGSVKEILYLESGIRFHTTSHQASLQQEGMPSPFCSKLRKHLRGLRLERAVQLGKLDRVVEFTFGTGSNRHSLILELYARGNVLLTNKEYEILALLRSHEYADQDVQVRVGHVYPVTYATSMGKYVQPDKDESGDKDNNADGILAMNGSDALQWAVSQLAPKDQDAADPKKSSKKGKDSIPLKALLLKPSSGVYHYGPSLLEHCILCAGLSPNQQVSATNLSDTVPVSAWDLLVSSLRENGGEVLQVLSKEDSGGYILYRERPAADANPSADSSVLKHSDKILEEFQPHLLKQHEGRLSIQYDNFAEAVDDFFFHIGGQKRALRAESAEAAAREKLNKVQKDLERRVESLKKEQDALERNAHLVKYHADDVDKALAVINSALDTGMDWEALEQLVEVEQQNQNPIALLIKRLDLEKDSMVLSLPDTLSGESSSSKPIDVSVSLNKSAYGNVREMFDRYRAAKEKSEKTIEASTKALKAAEATAQRQLEEAQKKSKTASIQAPMRKSHWFEKFHWFITSDNYLVLGGRDAQQNEMLVKRYLRPGDAYLHADVHGAASCVLRAKRQRTKGANGKTRVLPLSDQALREAGNFTICLSSAWSSRMVTSAWWVEPSQVSKTAPSGEYLTVGSFMVRGKKNFLPPSQLEMGLAVLFRLGDDDSIARHKNERRDFALMDADLEEEELDIIEESVFEPTSEPQLQESITPPVTLEEDVNTDAAVGEVPEARNADLASPAEAEPFTNDSDVVKSQDEKPDEQGDVQASDQPTNSSVPDNEEKPVKKKGLSVRDRKLIKKYGSLEEAEKAAAEREQKEKEKQRKEKPVTPEPKANSTPKRGKKSKLKRAAKRYNNQDDEDRELAMLALHGGEKKSPNKNNSKRVTVSLSQEKAAADAAELLVKDASKVVETLPNSVQDVLATCVSVRSPDTDETLVRWDKFDADVLESLVTLESEEQQLAAAKRLLSLKESTRVDNFSASLAGIIRTIKKYGHESLESVDNSTSADGTDGARRKTKSEKEKEKEAWREMLAEEGIVAEDTEEGEEMVDDTTEISKLTGKPHPDDSLLYVMPVCAPYQTLSKYKYKVKLTPGAQKRGKAAKQCAEMFLKMEKEQSSTAERDKELIKRVADNDWVQAICPNVKISAPGASKAAKKQKSGGKKGKKR